MSGRTSEINQGRLSIDQGPHPFLSDPPPSPSLNFKGQPVDFSEMSIHSVAGLLKLFLRELPEPLLPFGLYSEFIDVLGVPRLLLQMLNFLR